MGFLSGLGGAIGNVGKSVGHATGAPPPRPAPGGISGAFSQIAHAVHSVAHATGQAVRYAAHSPSAQHQARQLNYHNPSGDPAGPHGNYGQKQVDAFKNSKAYRDAIAAVFHAQQTQQKAAIISGLTKQNAWNSPEFKAVHDQWQHLPTPEQDLISKAIPKEIGKFIAAGEKGTTIAGLAMGAMKPIDSLVQQLPMAGDYGNQAQIARDSGMLSSGQIAKNALKDVVNLPAEAVATAGTLGGDVAQGKPGKALKDIVQPYAQIAQSPAKAFGEHPILSSLMVTGLAHGAARVAAAPVRALAPEASPVGRALSTQREGVAITGNLTHERPAFSKSPTIKQQQASIDRSLYTRAPDGKLVHRSKFLRARHMNQEVGGLVGMRERIRAVNRDQVKVAREKAVRPSVAARGAHAVKTALQYDPKKAVVPGANVLARIADATVRRPDTFTADLERHVAQVSANRPNLLDDPMALKAHDAYVKELSAEATKARTPAQLKAVFAAADKYGKDYAPVEAQAASLGHFGDMTPSALQRRSLMHYAVTHMDAKLDPERGLLDRNGHQLSNQAILDHIKGPHGTGGRIPAYTPDRVRFDQSKARQSYYVSSERRPLPKTERNTLYAYTHGLTHPGHDALTEQHALMQGVVDAHRSQNTYLETLATKLPGGKYGTYAEAKRIADNHPGYRPINLAQPFHPQSSLDKAMEGVDPATFEEEAMRHSLDLSHRLEPKSGGGRWAIIDEQAVKALHQFQNQISPNPLMRTFRGLNNQFRTVALSTSAKHIPGVTQENLIRDIAHGVGFRSWVTGRKILAHQKELNPQTAGEVRTQLTGGQVAGMTQAGKTFLVSDHWAGTSAYPVLKALEATFKAPGARQIRTAWQAWTKFAIAGTKKALEEQHQIAGLGKMALREHGYAEAAKAEGFLGLVKRGFALHGQMLDDAAKGLFDPAKARQARATINQMYGKWVDLSPSAQTALMFSPFGLWWVNSARFLARMPVDMPVKTSLLASATAGTQQERQAHGLDMFTKGALPLYEQGGIPAGGNIIAQNYYSPFGVANNPIETGASLIQPWMLPALQGAGGVDYLWKPLTAKGMNTNKFNEREPSVAQRAQYILNSALASFIPLYTKAQQVTSGGASQYDVSSNRGQFLPSLPTQTKTKGKGPAAGLEKALTPVRKYKAVTGQGGGAGWGGGGSNGSSGSSSGAGGWGGGSSGGGSSSGSRGGWGG